METERRGADAGEIVSRKGTKRLVGGGKAACPSSPRLAQRIKGMGPLRGHRDIFMSLRLCAKQKIPACRPSTKRYGQTAASVYTK